MQQPPTVVVDEPQAGVCRIRIDRPSHRNAIDSHTLEGLHEAFDSARDAAVIVLGSTDPNVFCSGADLNLEDSQRAVLSDRLYELYELMLTTPHPIIAAWDGPAVGGGAQLALASDVRIVGAAARLRFVGMRHGLALGAWALPGLVGRGRAAEWALTMRWVDAAEAWTAGLVSQPVEQPAAAALELATWVCSLDGPSVRRFKRLVNDTRLVERLRQERHENRAAWSGSMALPASED